MRFLSGFQKTGYINESNIEDEKSVTRTKTSEEMDSSNHPSHSMQKMFRTKTKDEPKKLDEALLKSIQDVKSEMQKFLSEFASGNVKEESHSSKVQTTLTDETLFKKFLKEKENDILKIVKSRNCNVRPRHLMDKTLDSDIQNLILNYDKKVYRKAERIFNDFIRKSEQINSVLTAHSFEVEIWKCLSSFAACIDYFLSADKK